MTSTLADLVALLNLERLEDNLFRGNSPQERSQRVFGGQVIGQALMAACRTVEDRAPHSLHGLFMLPGDPKVPLIYEVDRIRDGLSFTTRRVVAIQHGRPIFSMSASFHNNEEGGLDHQAEMPNVPMPETLPDMDEVRARIMPLMSKGVRQYYEREKAIEIRPVEFDRYIGKKIHNQKFNVWIRAAGPLPDDPTIHRSMLAYASDMTLLGTSVGPHGRTLFDNELMGASLDHALWLHRPFRVDEWLLYAQDTPNMHGSRGFARGLIFKQDGTLVASVAQEGLVRIKRPAP